MPVTGYGSFSAIEMERLLYQELVADLYHVVDALKKPTIQRPRMDCIKDLETILGQLGVVRPRTSRPTYRKCV